MPKKASISKEMILSCAFGLIRDGEELSVRGVARRLGCSIQPIFYNFSTMEALSKATFERAGEFFGEYVSDFSAKIRGKYPEYKAIGMSYIGFARDYPELFKLLFMTEGGTSILNANSKTQVETIRLLTATFGCDKQTAMRFQTEMWVYVHGFATMITTKYIEWDEQSVSEMLTDMFEGLKLRLGLKPIV